MIINAEVWLWGKKIAYIDLDEKGCVNFEYTEEFQKSNIELSPFMMPLSNEVYIFPELLSDAFKGAPGLIADSLPDKFGNAVIDRWLTKQGRTPESFNVIERLCYIGKRGMGALEYKPVISEDYSEEVEINELVNLANDVLQNRNSININTEQDDAINQLFLVSSSAGGARAKAIIAWNKEKNIIKSGQIDAGNGFDYYLIKFDGVEKNGDHNLKDSKGYTLVEYAYYLMAKDAGIEMMPSELFEEHGRHHFITKRFDRINGEKRHTQTFGAMCHIDYNIPRLASYEMLALRCIELGIPQKQIDELFRRMIFNVLAVNNDDHVKNFSFLMNKEGVWSLSPAYDLTYSYDPRNEWLSKHQMTINGKGEDIKLDDLLSCAKVMRINKPKAVKIINEVKTIVLDWRKYATPLSIKEETINPINEHIQRVVKQLDE